MNNIFKYISLIVIVGLFVALGWMKYQLDNSNDNVIEWQNRYATIETVHKVDSTSYAKQALIVNDLKSNNEELNRVVNKRNSELAAAASVKLSLSLKLDSIKTTSHIDTIYIDTTKFYLDSRLFTYDKDGVYMTGFFNIVDPYLLFINSLSINSKLDIGLTYTSNGVWEYLITTNSKYLSVDSINVKVLSDFTSSKRSTFGYLGGLGYYYDETFSTLGIGAGFYYKQFDVKMGTIFNGTKNAHIEVIYRSE